MSKVKESSLQSLLIELASEFINADLKDINYLINKSLGKIGRFVGADRSYIFSYDFNLNTCNNTFEWCEENIEPEIDNLQNIPIEYIPFWVESHRKGTPLYIKNVQDLPFDGEHGLRAILEPQGIKSLITLPMINKEDLQGFVGFDAVNQYYDFSENEKNILLVFASMLVNINVRKNNEEFIEKQRSEQEQLLKKLETQNKELKGIAAIVSHELSSPLGNINSLINWVLEDEAPNITENSKQSLKSALDNIEKIDQHLSSIKEYYSIIISKKINSWHDLGVLFENFKTKYKNNIDLEIVNEFPNYYGNLEKITVVFKNIFECMYENNLNEKLRIKIDFNENLKELIFVIRDFSRISINQYFESEINKERDFLINKNNSIAFHSLIINRVIESLNGRFEMEDYQNGNVCKIILPKKNDYGTA